MRALEHLAKQVGSALPQEEDEFEEMFEYPTKFPTEHMGRSAKTCKHAARDRSVGTAAVSYQSASTLEDVVHPHFNQHDDSDPMLQQGTLQHNEHDSNTNIYPLHSTVSTPHETVNDNVLKKGLGKYHLLRSIELSDSSSEEELHLNQDMTSEHSAACVPKDQGTFEGGSREPKNPLLPHILHRFLNYFFEGSEELTYSDNFMTIQQCIREHMQQELGVDMLDLVLHLTTVLALSMG